MICCRCPPLENQATPIALTHTLCWSHSYSRLTCHPGTVGKGARRDGNRASVTHSGDSVPAAASSTPSASSAAAAAAAAAAAVPAVATPSKTRTDGVSALEAATLEMQVLPAAALVFPRRAVYHIQHHQRQCLSSNTMMHLYSRFLTFPRIWSDFFWQRTNLSPIRARLLRTRKRSSSSML